MGFTNVRSIGLALFSLAIATTTAACNEGSDGDSAAMDEGSTGATDSSTGMGEDTITTTLTTGVTTLPPGDDDDDDDMMDTGTGDDDDDDDDDDMMDTGDTGEPVDLSCDAYCGLYMDACSDFNAYANMQECMDHCGQWPIGTDQDVDGDSLGCRIYHATVAGSTDPNVHCPHASPSGDGICAQGDAPDCGTYCETYMDNCDELSVYADMDDCMTQCDPWYPGSVDDIDGNSVGCRTYHAGAPAFGDPDTHCPHAGPGGAGVCVFSM